jgi:hypothetical protein
MMIIKIKRRRKTIPINNNIVLIKPVNVKIVTAIN